MSSQHDAVPMRFEDLAAASADAVFVMDTEARILFVNPAGARMLRRAAADVVGRTQAELFPAALAARHTAAVRETVGSGEPRRSESQDVSGLWLETVLSPIRSDDGAVTGVIGISRDVSARHRADESEERYRATVEHATVGIANLLLDGRLIGVNERLCGILGRAASELIGTRLVDLLHGDERGTFARQLEEVAAGRSSWLAREARCLRQDEGSTWVQVALSLVRDEARRPRELVAVIEDVSAKRQLEERLRQGEKLEAIGQVAGGVAHDFNNQLTAIIGYADLLVRDLHGDPRLRFAANILESARRSATLTRQLLAFARKGEFQRVPVDLHQLVGEVMEVLERSIDKRIRIERRLRAEPSGVSGDPGLLQSALLNLALNARDAMPDGGELRFETETVRIGLNDRGTHPPELGPGSYLVVSVCDTGCGMDAEVLARLFEPFFTTKEKGKGTGLGLAAVFGTAQRHGGAIGVSSLPGAGSTFRVYLPVASGAGGAEPAPAGGVPRLASGRVLVVDDEPLVREMVVEVLAAAGHRVEASENGRAGLERYGAGWHEIDLVLLDLMMPDLDGAETFRRLRRINPAARVLLCSGYSSDGEAQGLLAQGALGFVQKPFDRATLLRRVAEALAKGGQARPVAEGPARS